MEYGKTYHPANELEVVKMLRIDAGMRIDLQGVVVMRRVFEKTVKRVEHLVRQ